jgi:uncharacterized membrane protein
MVNKNQPNISVKPGSWARRFDIASWILLAGLWTVTIIFYIHLPDEIPSHYNAEGAVDDFSNKAILFLLALIATAVIILLTFLNRYPHRFNYLVKITEDNAAFQYRNALLMISVLKFIVVSVFLIIVIFTYLNGSGKTGDPGPALVIGLVLLPQLPLFYILYRSGQRG